MNNLTIHFWKKICPKIQDLEKYLVVIVLVLDLTLLLYVSSLICRFVFTIKTFYEGSVL